MSQCDEHKKELQSDEDNPMLHYDKQNVITLTQHFIMTNIT